MLKERTATDIRIMTIDDYDKVYALWMSCNEVKEYVDSLRSICDKVETLGLWRFSGKYQMSKALSMELLGFLSYLAAQDGKCTLDEASFITIVTGEHVTPGTVVNFVREQNILEDYPEFVSPFVEAVVAADNAMYSNGLLSESSPMGQVLLIDMYRHIGEKFIAAGATETARPALEAHIDRVQDYLNEKDQAFSDEEGTVYF